MNLPFREKAVTRNRVAAEAEITKNREPHRRATPREAKLDGSFFRVRAERTTEQELQYLRAMAELGPEPQKASDVAKVMKRTSEQMGPTRSRLIAKGLLYTPGYGLAAFTVPQFDRYMIRNHELAITPSRPAKKRRR
ncbi:MAG: hypothetical protein HYX32_14855 [Actinobacteria bacterium]|nr:hypothetical protein [Actinomycetota bacterium]